MAAKVAKGSIFVEVDNFYIILHNRCMRLTPKGLSILAASIWLAVGLFLSTTGVRLIQKKTELQPLLEKISLATGEAAAVPFLIALALIVGTIKARTALAKAAKKNVLRHQSFKEAVPFWKLFDTATYLLIASMMGMGIALRLFGIPTDIRAFILMIVGFALIQGAVHTVRITYDKALPQ